MAYIGKSPSGTGVRSRFYYTQTSGGGTSISGTDDNSKTLTFTDGEYIDVFLNGVLLVAGTDYNTNTANTISGLAALANGDVVEVVVYDIFTVADTVSASQGGTFNAAITANQVNADNIRIDGNTISSTDTNGDITLDPDGSGDIVVAQVASSSLDIEGDRTDSQITLKGGSAGAGIQLFGSTYTNYAGAMYLDATASTTGTNDAQMVFRTGSTPSEAMRIDRSGNVGIGTTSPDVTSDGNANRTYVAIQGNGNRGYLNIGTPSTAGADVATILFNNGANAIAYLTVDSDSGSTTNGHLAIGTSGSERMRITSGGVVNVGLTNGGSKFNVESSTNIAQFRMSSSSASQETNLTFIKNGSEVGYINCTTSSTIYGTSSDHRLKENVVDMSGAIDRVKALLPKRFNFIVDADTTVDGFLAHEAMTVVPEAVFGTHNEVDDDGNAKYQGIDQSKLVPLLTGALQEAIAKIETLETKVAALEAAS